MIGCFFVILTHMQQLSSSSHCPSFWYGVRALFKGIYLFWTHPRWWLYTLIPTLLMILITIGVWKGLTYILHDVFEVRAFFAMAWAHLLTLGGLYLFFPVLYEALCGLCFDGLSARVYRDILKQTPPKISFWVNLYRSLPSLEYSCCTFLLALLLGVILIIPWVGYVIWTLIFGYRFGVSYLFSSGLMRNETVKETLVWARANRRTVAGFGISAYLILLLFPFIGLLFVPCFTIAAVFVREGRLSPNSNRPS